MSTSNGISHIPVSPCLPSVELCAAFSFFARFIVSRIASTLANPWAAANNAELKKIDHFSDIMNPYDFRSVGSDTFAPAKKEARNLLFFIGILLSSKTGKRRGGGYLWQSLDIEAQRGDAISVSNGISYSRGLAEIFYVLQPSVLFWRQRYLAF